MIYTNKRALIRLKRVQIFSGISLLVAMTVAIVLGHYLLVLTLGSLLTAGLVFIRFLNFNFVRIQLENERLIIRYYALYSVDRSYESVEIPVGSLKKVLVKKYLFGMKWDLYLHVRLKQGMAGYPPVCLSAIPGEERRKLVEMIQRLV